MRFLPSTWMISTGNHVPGLASFGRSKRRKIVPRDPGLRGQVLDRHPTLAGVGYDHEARIEERLDVLDPLLRPLPVVGLIALLVAEDLLDVLLRPGVGVSGLGTLRPRRRSRAAPPRSAVAAARRAGGRGIPVTAVTPSRTQREPASLDRMATCRAPSTGTVNEAHRSEKRGALPALIGSRSRRPESGRRTSRRSRQRLSALATSIGPTAASHEGGTWGWCVLSQSVSRGGFARSP